MAFDESIGAGALYGMFFLMQSYGYATGARLAAPTKVYTAVLYGVSHLRYIVRPWDKVGVPLGPTVCGLMIMLVPWLDDLQADRTGGSSVLVDWYFAALVVLTVCGPGLVDAVGERVALLFVWMYERAGLKPIVVHGLYIAGFVLLVWLARVTVGTMWRSIPAEHVVAWEVIPVAVCAWLLFMSYGGSRFDGMLDRRLGTVPDELRSPRLLSDGE